MNNNRPTKKEKQSQQMRWSEELLRKLPPSLEESAKETGVIIRKRGIKSASRLLQMILVYVVVDLSQRLLATFAQDLKVAKVSDQAWQKKFQNACPG
jgi:hypothetical protein